MRDFASTEPCIAYLAPAVEVAQKSANAHVELSADDHSVTGRHCPDRLPLRPEDHRSRISVAWSRSQPCADAEVSRHLSTSAGGHAWHETYRASAVANSSTTRTFPRALSLNP